jgi:hypothetical protein
MDRGPATELAGYAELQVAIADATAVYLRQVRAQCRAARGWPRTLFLTEPTTTPARCALDLFIATLQHELGHGNLRFRIKPGTSLWITEPGRRRPRRERAA